MDAADIEIMAYAAKHDYVVLTHDLDFSAILAATQGTKPSVVQIRSDNLSPAVIGEPLIAALQQMTPELAAGALPYGGSGSHPTPPAPTALRQVMRHLDRSRT
jgi:predicted nuclease of predicted toxin-antitoxin system